jgi:2-polyprenyl-3-methyl-5-hydroxy-6-metoxy-1,4-benzoquinol methylase
VVEKNRYGFYSITNKPTESELEEYYNKKYYQGAKGSYELSYSEDEIKYFFNKIKEKFFVVSKFKNISSESSVIDIGCGEAWVLKFFKELGMEVTGLDYSAYGCDKFNPDCSSLITVGDIYKSIDELLGHNKTFDVAWLDNVLEHVIDPLSLLINCNKLLSRGGVLMVEVPNDFSVIQNYLIQNGQVDKPFWVTFPDHLSYFNKDGLVNLAKDAGLRLVFAMGDFPIDINLMSPDTNYFRDKTKGKSCYKTKLAFENLIHSISLEDSVNFYSSLMNLGIGRCLTAFFVKE